MSPPQKKRSYTSDTVYVDAFLKGLEEGKAAAGDSAAQAPPRQKQAPNITQTLRLVSLLRRQPLPTSELFHLSELGLGEFAAALASLKGEGLVEAAPAAQGADEILSLTPAGAALVS
ncbi:MAG: hypothetical protein HY875_10060 [Chloroflexi bacterium]|nr:hypothetical protein [Chloroflexota bacterium]